MSRKAKHWTIIVGCVLVLLAAGAWLVSGLGDSGDYRNMTGPVGIVKGPVRGRMPTTAMFEDSPLPPRRAMLGASIDDRDGSILVQQVLPGSSAENAGLRAGDFITAIGDVKTPTMRSLLEEMAKFGP